MVTENFLVDLVDVDNVRWVTEGRQDPENTRGESLVFRGGRRDGRVGNIVLRFSFPCISCVLRFPKVRVVAK